jgi:hypothetical protein
LSSLQDFNRQRLASSTDIPSSTDEYAHECRSCFAAEVRNLINRKAGNLNIQRFSLKVAKSRQADMLVEDENMSLKVPSGTTQNKLKLNILQKLIEKQ